MRASQKMRRAFLGGALLTIISVMLMLGSTMAWFQDSKVVINTYTFGNLDVDVVNEKGTTIAATTINFVKPDGGEYQADEFLFEPGATFRLKEFYVKNSGDVALKYRLKLDSGSATGDIKLLDAMDVYATMGGAPFALDSETRTLAARETDEAVQIYLHMKPSAGNEYQDLAVSGLIVKVIAVQDEGIPESELAHAFEEAAGQ
ncbi:MAG: hypothetical protein PUC93_02150 [Oscillospiraceae bacterium]|nr:hypothetical protein [Oscillospiraceae bacterium]